MQIKILYDNKRLTDAVTCGWGFACLISDRILFDTGEDWAYLNKNGRAMQVRWDDLQTIVISHNHWDHTGGLSGLLQQRPGLPVYGLEGFGPAFADTVRSGGGDYRAARPKEEIDPGICSTGEITGQYKTGPIAEQALVVDTARGLNVITGCAHPGIITILKRVRDFFPGREFGAVLGGFHLRSAVRQEIERVIAAFRDLGVKRAGPTHCSGEPAERVFREAYGKDFLSLGAGALVDL